MQEDANAAVVGSVACLNGALCHGGFMQENPMGNTQALPVRAQFV